MNIPLRDPSNIPDPYVKLYLLPGRSKESKRKTVVVKDNCNPVYDATFEYLISTAELMQSELEVTVCTQKGFLSGGSPIIGMVSENIVVFFHSRIFVLNFSKLWIWSVSSLGVIFKRLVPKQKIMKNYFL